MQVYNNGSTRVIGSAGRKKHERKDQDSWISITMYCDVSISVVNGLTIFLMDDKKNRVNYTEKFLRDNGAYPGSNVLIIPMPFVTQNRMYLCNSSCFL